MKSMTGIIEGFEGEFCKIERDGHVEAVPRTKVDVTAQSGDVVEWNGEQWIPNRALTAQRTKEIRTLMDDVWDD